MKKPALAVATLSATLAAATLVSCNEDSKKTETTTTQPAATPTPTPTPTPAPEPTQPLTVERKIEGKLTAKVRSVDTVARLITLEDNRGRTETFIVGPQVQRLNEVRPGDSVYAVYNATLTAELRKATPEEAANPITVAEVGGRADKTSDPAASAVRGVKVVTTVENIDLANMRVTLKGPLGDLVTVRAHYPDNIRKLQTGDTIVITYIEAAAIALDKAPR